LERKETFYLPPIHSLVLGSTAARMARYRIREVSPCAYRSRGEADLLFNTLHHEVRKSGKTAGRWHEDLNVHSEEGSSRFEFAETGRKAEDASRVEEIPDFNALIKDFDSMTNAILHEVRAANQ
jgi:hypothetical protein